jgi:hypothetical protein
LAGHISRLLRLRTPGIHSKESIPPGWESIPGLLKSFTKSGSVLRTGGYQVQKIQICVYLEMNLFCAGLNLFPILTDPGASGGHAGHPAVRHPVRATQADRVQPAGRHSAGGRPQPRQTERSAQERQQTLHFNFVSHENRSL